MRLILHIGPKKTGSTALQKYLYQNRNELSSRYQICYPIPHFGGEAHHELIYGINYQLNGTAPYAEALGISKIPHPIEMLQGYIKQATESDCQTIILSSETLFELNEKQQELLEKSTEGIEEIEYVFGVRDRVGLVVSRWQEEVKHGYTKSLSEYIESNSVLGPNSADYYQKILDIPAKNTNKKLKVKPFLYSDYDSEQNLFLEFLFGLSLSYVNLNLQPEEINESIKSGPLVALMTANHRINAQSSLVKSTHQEAWLQPIRRALDLREYVLKNTQLEGAQYSLISLLMFSDNKIDSSRKLNEMVIFSLKDFQLAFPNSNHDKYEQKLRTEIEKTLNEAYKVDISDFRTHLEKYKVIGIKLADDFAARM